MKTSVIQTTENRIIVDFIIKQIEERKSFSRKFSIIDRFIKIASANIKYFYSKTGYNLTMKLLAKTLFEIFVSDCDDPGGPFWTAMSSLRQKMLLKAVKKMLSNHAPP